jgi:hypothetical protein
MGKPSRKSLSETALSLEYPQRLSCVPSYCEGPDSKLDETEPELCKGSGAKTCALDNPSGCLAAASTVKASNIARPFH